MLKACVQWNPISGWKEFPSSARFESKTLHQQARALPIELLGPLKILREAESKIKQERKKALGAPAELCQETYSLC